MPASEISEAAPVKFEQSIADLKILTQAIRVINGNIKAHLKKKAK